MTAISLSARVLGLGLGAARVPGAVIYGFAIGLLMAGLLRRGGKRRTDVLMQMPVVHPPTVVPAQGDAIAGVTPSGPTATRL